MTMGAASVEADGQIVIQFQSGSERGIFDDFYAEHAQLVTLGSRDGGLTWQRTERKWASLHFPLVLRNGTWLDVVEDRSLISREQQRARLEQLGIGHIWTDDWL